MSDAMHEHSGQIYDDGTCDNCDWCANCEQVTEWEGEYCSRCGREWGMEA